MGREASIFFFTSFFCSFFSLILLFFFDLSLFSSARLRCFLTSVAALRSSILQNPFLFLTFSSSREANSGLIVLRQTVRFKAPSSLAPHWEAARLSQLRHLLLLSLSRLATDDRTPSRQHGAILADKKAQLVDWEIRFIRITNNSNKRGQPRMIQQESTRTLAPYPLTIHN